MKTAWLVATVAGTRSRFDRAAADQAAQWHAAGITLTEIARRQGCSLSTAHYRVRRATPDWTIWGRVMHASLRHHRWLWCYAREDYEQTVWYAVVAGSSYQTSGINRDRTRVAMRLASSLLDELAHDLGFTRRSSAGRRTWEKPETAAGKMEDMDENAESWLSWQRWARRYDGRSSRPKGASMQLNLQVVPFAGEPPAGAKLVLLPAEEGDETECQNCGGTGNLAKGDACRKCRGTGRGRFVQALRWDIGDADKDAVEQLLSTLRVGTRRQLTIRVEERGGGWTNTGDATIVAGLRGEKLPAVYGIPKCGAAHAVFYVHAALIVRYSHHRGVGSGSVSLLGIGKDHQVEQVTLWHFSDGEPIEIVDRPETSIEFPVDAVAAAHRKARDYHCRSAFYAAATTGASGPSGALRGAGAAWGGLPSPFKGPGIGYDDPA